MIDPVGDVPARVDWCHAWGRADDLGGDPVVGLVVATEAGRTAPLLFSDRAAEALLAALRRALEHARAEAHRRRPEGPRGG